GVNQMVRGQDITAAETAKNAELNDTAVKNAELGVTERDKAIGAEEALPGAAFDPSTKIADPAINAVGAESTQANANQQASSSWMGLVGGLADSAAGGIGQGVGKKIGGG
ncbi:MAG: hypothetical protein WCA31_00525, partial [Acidimicrobiales bacterium]